MCNQVRKTTGFVRPMRRIQQAAYPMVKLTQAEVAAMIARIQLCGDYDGSGDVSIADVVNLLNVLTGLAEPGHVPS